MSATMDQPATKCCTKCGEVKSLLQFGSDSSKKSGKRSHCKSCELKRTDAWKKNNREKVNAGNRKRRSAHPQKYIRKITPEKRKEVRDRYYARHPEKRRETNKRYRLNHPEKEAEFKARYRARQKAMREFFKMHRAMRAIAETLNQMTP